MSVEYIDKKVIEKEVIEQMKKLGTYKAEFDQGIKIFTGMVFQYRQFEKMFEESGQKITEEYTNKAGATNERKVPLYTAMESLRKDILSYSNSLCLNPKTLENITVDKSTKSTLASILSELK